MAKILYVEDDDGVAISVQEWLQLEGHLVELATNGEDGIQLCANFEYDLLLLDWDLPGIPGIEVCRRYRQGGGNAWIIFLTGKSGIDCKENGLDAGADDYLTKPFEIRELSARIRRALRRTESTFSSQLEIDDLVLNTADRTISVNQATVRLMPKESALLEYLMRNPNKLSNTNKLLSAVWPSDSGVSNGTVRTFMLSLRGKLEQLGKRTLSKLCPAPDTLF